MNHESLVVWLLAVVTLAFLCGFWLLPGGVLALRRRAHGEMQVDLRPGYSPDTLYRLLGLYGADGIHAFRRLLLADMVFPLVYAMLLVLLGDVTARAHPAAPHASSILRLAAIAAASFDYLENLFLLQVISRIPNRQ